MESKAQHVEVDKYLENIHEEGNEPVLVSDNENTKMEDNGSRFKSVMPEKIIHEMADLVTLKC